MSWFVEHRAAVALLAAMFIFGLTFGQDWATIPSRLDAQEAQAIDHELDHRARARVERTELGFRFEERCEKKERSEEACAAQQDSLQDAWAREDSLFEAEMAERLKK